jgi:hypothetical protein
MRLRRTVPRFVMTLVTVEGEVKVEAAISQVIVFMHALLGNSLGPANGVERASCDETQQVVSKTPGSGDSMKARAPVAGRHHRVRK